MHFHKEMYKFCTRDKNSSSFVQPKVQLLYVHCCNHCTHDQTLPYATWQSSIFCQWLQKLLKAVTKNEKKKFALQAPWCGWGKGAMLRNADCQQLASTSFWRSDNASQGPLFYSATPTLSIIQYGDFRKCKFPTSIHSTYFKLEAQEWDPLESMGNQTKIKICLSFVSFWTSSRCNFNEDDKHT